MRSISGPLGEMSAFGDGGVCGVTLLLVSPRSRLVSTWRNGGEGDALCSPSSVSSRVSSRDEVPAAGSLFGDTPGGGTLATDSSRVKIVDCMDIGHDVGLLGRVPCGEVAVLRVVVPRCSRLKGDVGASRSAEASMSAPFARLWCVSFP